MGRLTQMMSYLNSKQSMDNGNPNLTHFNIDEDAKDYRKWYRGGKEETYEEYLMNKTYKIHSEIPLKEYDVISYDLEYGQQLVVKQVLKDNKYEVVISSNNPEKLEKEYKGSIECYILYSILPLGEFSTMDVPRDTLDIKTRITFL